MNKQYLTRFPQFLNYTDNLELLEIHFGNDACLIRDIALIGSWNYSQNLFGYTELSIENFVKLGYTRTSLQRKLPEFEYITPELEKELIEKRKISLGIIEGTNKEIALYKKELKDLPFIHDHLCISRLDNALYRALKDTMIASIKVKDKITATSFLVLNELQIVNASSKNKRRYVYKCSAEWTKQMFKCYNLVDIEDYIVLGQEFKNEKSNIAKAFYLYMGKLISVAKNNTNSDGSATFEMTIDQICKILKFNFTEPKEKKRYVSKFLKEFEAKLKKTKFSWEYFSPTNERAKYHIRFRFERNILDFFDEDKKAALMKTIMKDAFSSFSIKKNDGKTLKLPELNEEEFWEWWIKDDDIELKDKIRNEAVNKVYKTIELPTEKSTKKPAKKIHRISKIEFEKMAEDLKKNPEILAKEQKYYFDEVTSTFYKYL